MAKKLLFILHIVNNCNRSKTHEKNLVDYCQQINHRLAKQIRETVYKVGKGELSVDDAVSRYGSF